MSLLLFLSFAYVSLHAYTHTSPSEMHSLVTSSLSPAPRLSSSLYLHHHDIIYDSCTISRREATHTHSLCLCMKRLREKTEKHHITYKRVHACACVYVYVFASRVCESRGGTRHDFRRKHSRRVFLANSLFSHLAFHSASLQTRAVSADTCVHM